MPRKKLPPVPPGEVLLEEFLRPLTALRLSRYLGTSERFWLNLQARYELEVEKDRLGDRLKKEVRVLAGTR